MVSHSSTMLKAFGIIVLVLSLITLCIWSQADFIRTLLDPDFVRVELHGRLHHQAVEVYWKSEGQQDSTLIYQSGNQLIKSFPQSGFNTFTVTYDKRFIGSIEQFKTAKYNSHSYNFVLEEHEGQIELVDVVISGIDGHR